MRKIIAALQMSVDGFIEAPNGDLDWVTKDDEEVWPEVFASSLTLTLLFWGE